MVKNPISNAVSWAVRKAINIAFENGRQLTSRGYSGDNSFFSELSLGKSDAGISVTTDKAMNYTAFWSCVTLLAGTQASLPLFLYERIDPRGKKRAIEHPLYRLLHDEPNPEMDSFSYIETLMFHLVASNGNCYSYIDWDDSLTEIKALWIMNPERTKKTRNSETGEIVFQYQSEKNGQISIPAYRVWHIPGFGYDGMIGYTPLTYARNQIGLGIAAEKLGAKIFTNGLTFGGILEHPNKMSELAQERFKKQLEDKYQGVDKAFKLLILEEGMKYNKNNIPPNDAQWLETRKFQKAEMASFFHIPPHMIGDLDRATFSNIEQQSLEFAIYTMRPWLVRFERSMNRQLLLPSEKQKYYMEFLIDGLLRGDMESRYRAYAIARNWGWMSANDVCELENRNSIGDQGDIYMAPANMVPADEFEKQILKPPQSQPVTTPTP
jgi:HK97 family phage portal protein